MRLVLPTAKEVGQIENARRFGLDHDAHDIFKLRHIPPDDLDALSQVSERGRAWVDIHTHHLFASRHQSPNRSGSDKTCAAKDKYGHGTFLLRYRLPVHNV